MRKIKRTVHQVAIKNLTAVGDKIKTGTSRAVVLCELWSKDEEGVSYLKEYVRLDTGDLIALAKKPKRKFFYKGR